MESLDLAKKIRELTFRIIHSSQGSHIGSALSVVDILSVMYDGKSTDLSLGKESNDKFILSKGHGCASLYATLHCAGFFSEEELFTYGQNGSDLMNHISHKVNGVNFSTGSLGHGLPFAVGIALANKIKKVKGNVYVVTGDGEFQEGSMWESLLIASQFKLDNLIVIVDNNNLQSLTTVEKTININFEKKLSSFGSNNFVIDAHNHSQLKDTLTKISHLKGKPHTIVAKSIKGKGVSFMENKVEWHYRTLNDELLNQSLKENN
tara:strand:+ start:2385 stop:3173 length:789 start_codon:yes stop_codon:yes gene_type:complete